MEAHATFRLDPGIVEVNVVGRAWAVIVALALVGCGGGAQPKEEPEPAVSQPGQPAPAAAGLAVQGATLHEVVRSIAQRENLNIRVDSRVDGPVEDATRER